MAVALIEVRIVEVLVALGLIDTSLWGPRAMTKDWLSSGDYADRAYSICQSQKGGFKRTHTCL